MPIKGKDVPTPDISVHEYVWQLCLNKGDEVFLIDNAENGKTITYTQFYERSRNCAAFLCKEGYGRGDFIGLCAPNSLEYAVSMIGIMGCGATVTPCNPSYKEGEILQQFRISEPTAVFVYESALGTMIKVKEKVSSLKSIYVIGRSEEYTTVDAMFKDKCGFECLDKVKISPENDLAILPYSSGTTGMPKSVMLTHRNLAGEMTVYKSDCSHSIFDDSCAYMDRPFYHSGGYGCFLFSVVNRLKTVIEKEFEVETMLKAIEKYKVTHLISVPPIMIQLVNSEVDKKYDTSSLQYLIGGGAAMAPDILRRLVEKFNVTIAPVYGLTEAGVLCIGTCRNTPLISCGSVSTGVELKIIDLVSGKECSVGENGEILSRNTQTTKGYLKNPKETSKAIEPDGWFHTGDIGHVDENGFVYVVDRLKEVIKNKTLQVSPAELESVILEHPKVADVGVIGISDPEAGEIPKAFVVKKDSSLTMEEVIEYVKSQVVDYKHLRGGVKFVEEIPKSEAGKIQRIELKKMAGD